MLADRASPAGPTGARELAPASNGARPWYALLGAALALAGVGLLNHKKGR